MLVLGFLCPTLIIGIDYLKYRDYNSNLEYLILQEYDNTPVDKVRILEGERGVKYNKLTIKKRSYSIIPQDSLISKSENLRVSKQAKSTEVLFKSSSGVNQLIVLKKLKIFDKGRIGFALFASVLFFSIAYVNYKRMKKENITINDKTSP